MTWLEPFLQIAAVGTGLLLLIVLVAYSMTRPRRPPRR